jgi:hypothetical protein
VGSWNGDVVRRAYMGLAMMSPPHPRMLLWGQLRRCKCKARWMCNCSIHTVKKIAHAGGDLVLLYLLRTVDCSKSAVADKRLFLALMAIGKKVRVVSG